MTIPPLALPVVRRAIVDLLAEIGGEQSDDTLSLQLLQLGHRLARRDVAEQMRWLAQAGLIEVEQLGPYLIATTLPDALDVAGGRLAIDGISRHRTGGAVGTARV